MPLLLYRSGFNQTREVLQILLTISNMVFHENPPDCSRETDRSTDMTRPAVATRTAQAPAVCYEM
jgi:hypothetical protein